MTPKKPLLERVAVQYFYRRSNATKHQHTEPVDAVHYLNPQERAGLRRVMTGAVARSALVGAISAAVSAYAELVANPHLPDTVSPFSAQASTYWLILVGATLVASMLEILYLYWDTLRSMHQLAVVAGLQRLGEGEENSVLVAGLARAALELPNPVIGPHGIDPRQEASKTRLLMASLAYKAKVGLTNFLVKMLVRRMMGRVFVRSVVTTFVPFVAVPITAGWNAVVTWLILREGRVRAIGPSAVEAFVNRIFADARSMSPAGRLAAVRAVAAAIVRTQDFHPNLLALLAHVTHRAGDLTGERLDDVKRFIDSLKELPAHELVAVQEVLVVACVIDGRLTRPERRLWREARDAIGASSDSAGLERLRRAFAAGDAQVEALLTTVVR